MVLPAFRIMSRLVISVTQAVTYIPDYGQLLSMKNLLLLLWQVCIEGRVLHEGVSTNGTRFLTEESYIDGNSQDMTVVGVEEYVLGYYKKNGFPSGIHINA